MILVDVYVPSLDETFDFQLDENTPIRQITDEIGEMLGKKVRVPVQPDRQRFMLCSYDSGSILSGEHTLRKCGIRNGSRLLLV